MPQKMFRLSDEQISKLKQAAELRGCTQTDMVRSFIDSLDGDNHDARDTKGDTHRDTQVIHAEPYACHTSEETPAKPPVRDFADDATSAAIAALTEQLAVKDRQISDLSSALVSAQKSVEQAHALHAADKKAALEGPLETASAPPAAESARKTGRWRRLMDAWRGSTAE